jgi:hypothetical protein
MRFYQGSPWPYTPDEQQRILKALAPADNSDSGATLEWIGGLSGFYRDREKTGEEGPDPFDRPMKKRLEDIKKATTKLSRLLGDKIPADGTTFEVGFTGLPFTTLRDTEAQLAPLMVEIDRARRQWSRPGTPGNRSLRLYARMLVEIWLAEHPGGAWWNKTLDKYDSKRGDYSEDTLTGPFPEFIDACIEPVMSPSDQRALRRYLRDKLLPALKTECT